MLLFFYTFGRAKKLRKPFRNYYEFRQKKPNQRTIIRFI